MAPVSRILGRLRRSRILRYPPRPRRGLLRRDLRRCHFPKRLQRSRATERRIAVTPTGCRNPGTGDAVSLPNVVQEIPRLRPDLVRRFTVLRIGVFGSFARGEENADMGDAGRGRRVPGLRRRRHSPGLESATPPAGGVGGGFAFRGQGTQPGGSRRRWTWNRPPTPQIVWAGGFLSRGNWGWGWEPRGRLRRRRGTAVASHRSP